MAVIVSKQIVVPVRGKRASDYAVGDIVKIKENGIPEEYRVVHQGLPGAMYDASCDGCWVLREDLAVQMAWDSTAVNDYANSTANTYLNGEWLTRFDEKTKAAIKQVKIPYRPGNGDNKTCNTGDKGLSVKGFLLSYSELSFNFDYMPTGEGAELAYFKGSPDIEPDGKRKKGNPTSWWWSRSPTCYSGAPTGALSIDVEGGQNWNYYDCSLTYFWLCPAHILRSDTLFDSNNILKG